MAQFDELVGDTLAQVNIVRRAFGLEELFELPDARPGDTQDCLYFRGLEDAGVVSVGSDKMTFKNERQAKAVANLWGTKADGQVVDSPTSIKRVITEFDNANTPQYDI